ncbi:tetratricopeptide repeat protein [Aquimarina sp. W85]|uniref:tetratricopeptide repeat protein n=1 Tax=Aquimarina rhodophyticola TaxID=3342246 RepID=UPI0036717FD9
MEKGFDLLETGQYQKAEVFFAEVLKEHPSNKTARLCYGRSIGLSGKAEKAVILFEELKKDFPQDFEVMLNYAESLLWSKRFTEAEKFYKTLIAQQPTSFPAMLGYANALSNLKQYAKALEAVNTALTIQKGNSNALISRKYIRLGYSSIMVQDKNYNEALVLLEKNLEDFPNDKDSQLTRASIYLNINKPDEAKKVYEALATNAKDSIVSLNGLSLVAHKKDKNKTALRIVEKALSKAAKIKSDTTLYLSTYERYVQALLWNQKFKKAANTLKELSIEFPSEPRITALEAARGMYISDFKTSLDRYSKILQTTPSSFDGNLGIANAYRATKQDMKAYEYAYKTLNYYPKQPDATKLITTLKKAHTPTLEKKTSLTFDNGNNEAFAIAVQTKFPITAKWVTNLAYQYRNTKNTITKNEATSNDLTFGSNYSFNSFIQFQASIGLNSSESFTTSYDEVTAKAEVTLKPLKLLNLAIGYNRELQSFNADLIDQQIIMNNYYLTYNVGTNFNLGWYTQLIHTTQTDNNTRDLLFTSLYYTFFKKPILKGGINYQYISFKNQVPTIYFSPSKFNVGEVFLELLSDSKQKLFYNISTAAGIQYIEDDPASSTFRASAKIGYKFTDRLEASIYSNYSNIASATAAGFRFTEVGFKVLWQFLKQPIFNKRIEEIEKKAAK